MATWRPSNIPRNPVCYEITPTHFVQVAFHEAQDLTKRVVDLWSSTNWLSCGSWVRRPGLSVLLSCCSLSSLVFYRAILIFLCENVEGSVCIKKEESQGPRYDMIGFPQNILIFIQRGLTLQSAFSYSGEGSLEIFGGRILMNTPRLVCQFLGGITPQIGCLR